MLAPIAFFAYNRPWHTRQALDSLAANAEAKDSVVYIYCDGAKQGGDAKAFEKISEVRTIAHAENRFKEVIVLEQPVNKGLGNSIINGVTAVVNKHGKVIVLEDDLVLSPFFLYYMNDSLTRYEQNLKVGQIGACNFFACGNSYPSTFFIPIPDCWGWATWKNRWAHFNSNGKELFEQLKKRDLMHKFNVYGSYDMEGLLINQIKGIVSSWAIRWQAVCILNNWLTLYPNKSMTNHIESEEATHADMNITPPLCLEKPNLETVEAVELENVINSMKLGYSGRGDYFGKIKIASTRIKLKRSMKSFIPDFVRNLF